MCIRDRNKGDAQKDPNQTQVDEIEYGDGVRPKAGGERKSKDFYTVLVPVSYTHLNDIAQEEERTALSALDAQVKEQESCVAVLQTGIAHNEENIARVEDCLLYTSCPICLTNLQSFYALFIEWP